MWWGNNMTVEWLGEGNAAWRQIKEAEHGPHRLGLQRVPLRKLVQFDEDGNVVQTPGNLNKRNVLLIKYIEQAQQNQQAASCCRHPENHDVVALYSCEAEKTRDGKNQPPDIYLLICKEKHDFGVVKGFEELGVVVGEAHHRKFCTGGGPRPGWDIA